MEYDKSKKLFEELNSKMNTKTRNKEKLLEKGLMFRAIPFTLILFACSGIICLVSGIQFYSAKLIHQADSYFILAGMFLIFSEALFLVLAFYPELPRKKLELLQLYSQVKKREKELEALESD